MIRRIKGLTRHSPLLFILAGAGSTYVLNIGLAYLLSPQDYAAFGLFSSYILIAGTFALLGVDQLILRHAVLEDATSYSRRYLTLSRLASIVFAIGSALAIALLIDRRYALVATISAISSSFLILQFTNLRLAGHFNLAQFQRNLWRLLLLLVTAALAAANLRANGLMIAWALCGTLIASAAVGHLMARSATPRLTEAPADTSMWPAFNFSMLLMNVLTHADRFFVAGANNHNLIAGYFLLQNLLLAPLSQLQTYVGFRELNDFKRGFDRAKLNDSTLKALLLGTVAGTVLLFGFLLASKFVTFPFYSTVDPLLSTLLIISGIVRICYSVLSAAMGATGSQASISRCNWITVAAFACCAMSLFFIDMTPVRVTTLFLVVWTVRCGSFYLELYRTAR